MQAHNSVFDDEDEDAPKTDVAEPGRLRALRIMVMALTGVLIIGVLAVATTLVIRLASPPPAPIPSAFYPAALQAARLGLPRDEAITALGASGGVLMIVTRAMDGRETLRVFDANSGAQLRAVAVTRD